MENISEKESGQIKLSLTVPKGYIVTYKGPDKNANLKGVMKMIKKAEKNNVLLSQELIQNLCTIEANDFKEIKEQFDAIYISQKGQIFRSVFATGEDISDEEFTFDDFIKQISHYCVTYGLGEIDYDVFEIDEKRKVQLSNISKRKDKQEINNTFKILGTKSVQGFLDDVKVIVQSPIVFGEPEIQFIKEADRFGFLGSVINSVQDFKVKENMFQIIDIVGKDFVKNNGILKTSTDVLRYCYWTSGLDFTNLEKGVKFNLKTTDKKIVMMNLNTLAVKHMAGLFGDMRPYKSQWLSVSRNLFPGSKKFRKFSSAQQIFDYIRNGGNLATFNTITADLIEKGKYSDLIEHLSNKPGELLRSLDMIARKADKKDIDLLVSYIESSNLNPKLVIQVRKWLEYRTEHAFSERTFNVKGKPKTVTNKSVPKLKTKRTLKVTNALRAKLIEHLKGKELF